ncbi:MAG: hypothetical protein QJR06_03025 [Alicyclobacillaceae bacterium]|nr:hypothetical protein [Alicyclobacillaceae bacterium]
MRFTFTKAQPFAFFYDEAHLVLWQFEREGRRDLYVLHEGEEDTAVLEYPGETFTQRILDELGGVFFISVDQDGRPVPAALGASFEHNGRRYAAYYSREEFESPTVWFFRLDGSPGAPELEPLDEEEHRAAAEAFARRYAGVLRIRFDEQEGQGRLEK